MGSPKQLRTIIFQMILYLKRGKLCLQMVRFKKQKLDSPPKNSFFKAAYDYAPP